MKMTTINETMKAAIDSAPVGTAGLVIEPWSVGETYGVAANWAQASAPVYFYGSDGWESRQYQVADFRHRKIDALELELMEALRASGDDEAGAAELLDDAVAFSKAMLYRLSERQRESLRRGHILRIALPHPPERVDPLAYARACLDAPTSIISAAFAMIAVDAAQRSGNGLDSALGMIRPTGATWPVEIRCIVAHIGDVGGLLPEKTQWPASVVLANGWTIPRENR